MTGYSTECYSIAWQMYARRCEADEVRAADGTLLPADEALVQLAWLDPNVRAFWLGETQAFLDAQAAAHRLSSNPPPRKAGT